MSRSLFACIPIGHDNVPHLAVLLKHLNHALKERLRKRVVDTNDRFLSDHCRTDQVTNLRTLVKSRQLDNSEQ